MSGDIASSAISLPPPPSVSGVMMSPVGRCVLPGRATISSSAVTNDADETSENIEAIDVHESNLSMSGRSVVVTFVVSSSLVVDNAINFSCNPFKLFMVGRERCLSKARVFTDNDEVEDSRDIIGRKSLLLRVAAAAALALAEIGMMTLRFFLENLGAGMAGMGRSLSSSRGRKGGDVGGVGGR